MKDCIIGAIKGYGWPVISSWVNSLNQCGFEGDRIVFAYETGLDVTQRLEGEGFKVISKFLPDGKEVHMARFLHAYQELSWGHYYRYVISTDVRDVIFQSNPSDWLENNLLPLRKELNFSSEGILLKDELWGRENVRECFGASAYERIKDNLIINSGVIAGELKAMVYLMAELAVYSFSGKCRLCDQAALNVITNHSIYRNMSIITSSSAGWAVQLGTLGSPALYPLLVEQPPIFKDGEYYTQDGIKYCIVHQYDRCPGPREEIWAKYWEA